MSIDVFGVRVSNPDCLIVINGESYAEMICYQHLHTENLKRLVSGLHAANRDGSNELLAALQVNAQAMANASLNAVMEHIRIAQMQGLRFELVSESDDEANDAVRH